MLVPTLSSGALDTLCYSHPGVPAVAACTRCGSFACAACLGTTGLCRACAARTQWHGFEGTPGFLSTLRWSAVLVATGWRRLLLLLVAGWVCRFVVSLAGFMVAGPLLAARPWLLGLMARGVVGVGFCCVTFEALETRALSVPFSLVRCLRAWPLALLFFLPYVATDLLRPAPPLLARPVVQAWVNTAYYPLVLLLPWTLMWLGVSVSRSGWRKSLINAYVWAKGWPGTTIAVSAVTYGLALLPSTVAHSPLGRMLVGGATPALQTALADAVLPTTTVADAVSVALICTLGHRVAFARSTLNR